MFDTRLYLIVPVCATFEIYVIVSWDSGSSANWLVTWVGAARQHCSAYCLYSMCVAVDISWLSLLYKDGLFQGHTKLNSGYGNVF